MNKNGSPVDFVGIQLPGEEISWVGECPWTGRLCAGTDSGKLFVPGLEPVALGPLSTETVNGVAFSGDYVGISTRDEVSIYNRITHTVDVFFGGAHEIAASAQGFVAPLGINGLLVVDLQSKDQPAFPVVKSEKATNFYKATRLGLVDEQEVFACAVRKNGLSSFALKPSTKPSQGTTHLARGRDVIDVCGIGSAKHPLAVAGLCIDRSLLLSRDVQKERSLILNFAHLTGTAYTLLAARGHVFLLTSDALFIFPNLAARFLDGEFLDPTTEVRWMPIHAVDAYLAYDGLFLVLPDSVKGFAIDQLVNDLNRTFTAIPVSSQNRIAVPFETYLESSIIEGSSLTASVDFLLAGAP